MFVLNILVFLFALGLLVFVHELGHFIAAKACGVYVNRFSLGMPPRAFGITVGETDYCISAVPFGGYVRMAGQEDAPLSEEEREEQYGHIPPERWLNNKPLWQRAVVFALGPLMNLVLAFALYALVAATGANIPETQVDNRVGAVDADSPAATAPLYRFDGSSAPDLDGPPDATGWATGDRVVSINGDRIDNITDVAMAAVLGKGTVLKVLIERTQEDGTVARYLSPITPVAPDGEDMPRIGITAFESAYVAGVLEDKPAHRHGIQPGDIVERFNGTLVDRNSFIEAVAKTPENTTANLTILRDGERIDVALIPETTGRIENVHFGAEPGARDVEAARPVVIALDGEEAEEIGLMPKDIVTAINGQPATVSGLTDFERDNPGKALTMTIERPAILFGITRPQTTETVTLKVSAVRAIGVSLGQKMVFHRVETARIVPEAFRFAYRDFKRTITTVRMLATGGVSPKNIGGPVMIYQATTRAAQAGYWWFVRMTAFISVNLFVFNLLPLPILDGGQILLLGIEGVRRRPVSMKAVERFQQVGLVLIIGLMLFVTYNDILRIFKGLMP